MEKKMEKEKEVKEGEAHGGRATYAELNNYCVQLSEQNRQLIARLREAEAAGFFRRMDYLFRVVENPGGFDHGFVTECADEIRQALFTPAQEGEAAKGGE